ncbi:RidA family protein [uncultured Lentibacter sp.]|uniref:RidA family protein n=1 Tax=uncultured Lentibacter sp. TaxID=1659309 RepID=UPI002612CE68|nr:RidA family protein [uncultured Lentibacter sp.]
MSPSERMEALGLFLPPTPTPAAHYVPWVTTQKTVYAAGQTPKEGTVLKYAGQLGTELTADQGYAAARLCALRLLSVLKAAAGDLENIERILKVTVFVNAAADFSEHSRVADGASEVFNGVLGAAGSHARSTVGAPALPGNAAVEIELIARIS